MKSIKMLMMATLTILSVAVFAQEPAKEKNKMKKEKMEKAEQKSYSCPMHPDVISNNPGKCSVCKMDLKEKEKHMVAYACPMKCEGDVTYDKAGKCPKCNMNLKEVEKHAVAYACPMKCEGDKTYDKAGSCPKCGMDLKEKKDEHAGHKH